MADQSCCDVDAESLAELAETTVEVPVALLLACGCSCGPRCCC